MSHRFSLAIVGCGDIGGYVATVARLTPGYRLAACCDRDAQVAESFARRHRIPVWHTDYTELLEAGGFEAVYLATPHDLHLPMARAALERGLAVLCEKPLAATLPQGIELARLAQAPGARLAVNYQYRFDNACYAIAQAARSGELGSLRYLRINLPWHREPAYYARSAGWHASLERAGGGTLLTVGSHFIDLAHWFCSSRTVRAQGITARVVFRDVEVEDIALCTLELANGALVQVCSSMVATPERPATLELYAEKGTAIYRAGNRPRAEFLGVKPRRARLPVPGLHALQRSLTAFKRYAQGEEAQIVSAADALHALAAVDGVYRSAESGRWEAVAD